MTTTAEPTIVLVHGFMDDAVIWTGVRSGLEARLSCEVVALDLAGGSGNPTAPGPFTLRRFVDDVTTAVDAINGPVVLVGHSMGTQIGELVAAARPKIVRALVLLTPIPLAGMQLPAEMADGMKALTSAPIEDQRGARLGLSPDFPSEELDRLIVLGAAVPAATVSDVLDVWDQGDPAGAEPSKYTGPVLVLPGAIDPFVTAEVIAAGVSPRFTDVRVVPVPGTGHWPHAEAPTFVAAAIAEFLLA